MLAFRLFRKMFTLLALFCVPFIILGGVFFGKVGALAGLSLGALGVLFIAIFSESLTAHIFKGSPSIQSGSLLTLREALDAGNRRRIPDLYVYPDPIPDVLTLRSFGGKGAILLSQGLLSLVSEEELRGLLRLSDRRNFQRGAVLQGFCLFVAMILFKSAPRSWGNLLYSAESTQIERGVGTRSELGPFSALISVLFFPFIRFLLKMGNLELDAQCQIELSPACLSALHKINQAVQVLRPGRPQHFLSVIGPCVSFPADVNPESHVSTTTKN